MAADSLSVIAVKLDQIAERQDRTDSKVSAITERVLNPENGVFAKVRTNDALSAKNREDIDKLSKSVDKLLSICETHERTVSAIERWTKEHEERDSELRQNVNKLAETIVSKFEDQDKNFKPIKEDFIIRNSNKVWKDRVVWLIISALITALALPPIVNLFKNDYEIKPKIETMLK